ncbi:hypothetical protein ACTMU2_39240 [Cupriavidus basilensis]
MIGERRVEYEVVNIVNKRNLKSIDVFEEYFDAVVVAASEGNYNRKLLRMLQVMNA